MKNNIETIDALIFIDTNIFLDFYRKKNFDISINYLEQIENHLDKIITGSQVEMEYKKKRQVVILESVAEIKKIGTLTGNIPAILYDRKAFNMIVKLRKDINKQKKKLISRIDKIFKDPKVNDPVYKSLQKLFKYKSEINLNRENKKRVTIRNLAKKRFCLGYPPRKKSDNSIGDAINWEWIVSCAQKTGKHIILVSRDSDFGKTYEKESYLNDWLTQEFKERVSKHRKILLTDKLSKAFQLVKIPVTKAMIDEENEIINFSAIQNNFLNSEFLKSIKFSDLEFDWMKSIETTPTILDKLNFDNNSQDDK